MGNSQSKVELYAAIRRDHRMGMSLRALQRTHNVTWKAVRRALKGQWPEPRKKQRRKESRLDPYKPLVHGMLLAERRRMADPGANGAGSMASQPSASRATRSSRLR